MIFLYLIPIIIQILPCYTYYESSKYITTFNPKTLYELRADQSDDLWCVQFYDGSNPLMPEISEYYERTGRAVEGHAKLGAIDVQKFPLVKYVMEVENIPSYLYYSYYKYLPMAYELSGANEIQLQTAKQLNYLFDEKSFGRYVERKENFELGINDLKYKVNDSDDPWGVVFYDANCQNCKDFGKVWEELVVKFEGIQFGSIDDVAAKVLANETEYPVVKYYKTQKETPLTYEGALEYEQLHKFFLDTIDDPQILHVNNFKTVAKCLKALYCIFSFFPKPSSRNLIDRAGTLKNLTEISNEYKHKSWIWFWNDYGEQGDIEEAFEIQPNNYPVVVALNVHVGTYMKIDLGVEPLEQVINNIEDGVGFNNIKSTKVPDIKKIKSPISKDEL